MSDDPVIAHPTQEQVLKARILIVDDNPANVRLLEAILQHSGYANLWTTTDSREVEELHKKWHFDLILLDIRMPHMDGFQVMERLADTIKNDYLPVLVLTAQTDSSTQLRALEMGAKDFVTKPFQQAEVLHRIRNMLEVRMFYNMKRWHAEVLEAEVRARTQEVRETQLEIVRRLARAGEYRDNETGMHVIRMSKFCQALALAADLSSAMGEMILHASPMHDLGKIGIPDRILLKPGKLLPDEWEVMKTHAEIGAGILSDHPSELIRMASQIALTHHEKWDGSGYPRGIAGEDIPIAGRIAAICDVFDALTSERPYKKAWPVEEALAFLNENAGSHFDPRLTPLFAKVLPDILDIRERYADGEIAFAAAD